jgi:hypothetical protein
VVTALNLGDGDIFPPNTRAICRWISLTLTFEPQFCEVDGEFIKPPNICPALPQSVFTVRAPQAPNGGLVHAISKGILDTDEGMNELFQDNPVIFAASPLAHPETETYSKWIKERLYHCYFEGMRQTIKRIYLGLNMATEFLLVCCRYVLMVKTESTVLLLFLLL